MIHPWSSTVVEYQTLIPYEGDCKKFLVWWCDLRYFLGDIFFSRLHGNWLSQTDDSHCSPSLLKLQTFKQSPFKPTWNSVWYSKDFWSEYHLKLYFTEIEHLNLLQWAHLWSTLNISGRLCFLVNMFLTDQFLHIGTETPLILIIMDSF